MPIFNNQFFATVFNMWIKKFYLASLLWSCWKYDLNKKPIKKNQTNKKTQNPNPQTEQTPPPSPFI